MPLLWIPPYSSPLAPPLLPIEYQHRGNHAAIKTVGIAADSVAALWHYFWDRISLLDYLADGDGDSCLDSVLSGPRPSPLLLHIKNQQGRDAALENPVGITADAVAALQQLGEDVAAVNPVGITSDVVAAP